ncbi:MAG: tetratricopeptide repeat protein [Pseudomonadota bacterium]
MAEHLTEEEQLAAVKDFWDRYGTWILIGLVAIGGAYFGNNYYRDLQQTKAEGASEVYQAYQENLDDQALSKRYSDQLDTEYAGTAYQVFSLLKRAQQSHEAGDSDDGEPNSNLAATIDLLEQAVTAADHPRLRDLANLRLARARQAAGDSASALAALAAVEGEGYRGLVAELKGDIHAMGGETALAREAYEAAKALVTEDRPRPILDMKMANLPQG